MNEAFLERMKQYLGAAYSDYEQSLQEAVFRGIRVNTSKLTIDDFMRLNIVAVTPSHICPQSFYINEQISHLGNHPAHLAGLFYMQEPSAASAVEALHVQQGDWVLDMCAAPGGKSTQIAAKLNHSGFLISNEIERKRANILLSNMERMGYGECMVISAHPNDIAEQMQGWFDKVLVDAPCSGEGMFKKHSKAMEDWSEEHVRACGQRQLQILESAYAVLKQDGVLVYSTCTYAMEENEMVIAQFLEHHDDMELLDADVAFGRSGFEYKHLDSTKLRRIFPMDGGEGHFIARLCKRGAGMTKKRTLLATMTPEAYVQSFLSTQLTLPIPYVYIQQDKVYGKQTPFIKLKNITILRQGVFLGEMIKKRFEPHQHLYSAAQHQGHFIQTYDMNDEQCLAYLQGNVINAAGYKGYTALTWRGYPIAFAKGDGNILKNKYPKGLRLHG